MIKRYVDYVVRHPIVVILLVVGVTFLFGSQIWNLEKVLDPKRILPQGHPYVQLNNEIEKRFGGSRVVVIGVVAKEGDIFNANTLEKIQRITEAVKQVPGILEGNVVSISDRKIKAITPSLGGLEIKRLMETVPTTKEEMEVLKKNIFENDMYVGSLVSSDGKAAAIITDFQGGAALEAFWTDQNDSKGSGTGLKQEETYPSETQGEGGAPSETKGSQTETKPWEKWKEDSQKKEKTGDDGKDFQSPKEIRKSSGDKDWNQGDNPPDSIQSSEKGLVQKNPEGTDQNQWNASSNAETGNEFSGTTGESGQETGEEAPWKKWQKGAPGSQKDESNDESWKKWAGEGESGYISDSTIYANLLDIAEREKDPSIEIHIGGLPVALAFLEADTELMNRVVFPLAFLVIMLVLYLSFRSFQGMLIPVFTALMSVVWAIGLMGLFRIPLDPWTQTLTPILIVAIAAGHSLQMLKRYYEELGRLGSAPPTGWSQWKIHRGAVIESTTKMIPVMATAGSVAAISFASLVTFELKTFQSFGLLTAFGIFSAVILEMTFIPACRTLLPPPPIGNLLSRKNFLDRRLESLGNFLVQNTPLGGGAKSILWVSMAAALFAMVSASQVKVNNSLKSQFFEETQFRQDDAALNRFFGGTSTFYVLVQTHEPEGLKDPQVMRDIEGLQKRIAQVPGVGKTQSYVDYIKKMNRSLHGGDLRYDAIPDSRGAVAEYLFLYSISGNPADFDRLVDYDYQRAVLWAFLKSDSTELAEELIFVVNQYAEDHFEGFNLVGLEEESAGIGASPVIQEIDACGHQVSCIGVAGSAPVTVALNKTMVEGKIENIFQISLIAFLVSSLVLRSLLGGFLVLLPLALAVLINFGVMGLTGITLGIGTAAISAMAVGMGADYAIYFLFRLREEWAREGRLDEAVRVTLKTAGKAILSVGFAISAGCFTLVFPGYYLHMEGLLVPLAMLTSSVGAITLLPALVILLSPKFLKKGMIGTESR